MEELDSEWTLVNGRVTRRTLLGAFGAAGAAAFLVACGGDDDDDAGG